MGKLKDKLREIDLRLTDLAYYMQISRPTLYKYIDEYESGRSRNLKKSDSDLFKFIMKKGTKDRKQVIHYLLNLTDTDNTVAKLVSDYEKEHSDEKITLIKHVMTTDYLNEIIPYLNYCIEKMCQDDSLEYDENLQHFFEFKKLISTNRLEKQ